MVKDWKKEDIQEMVENIESYPGVGVISMHQLPAPQLQEMRKDLHGKAEIRMSRKTLMERALDESDSENITGLADYLKGESAFIFTDMNPFQLHRYLKENKSSAPAKPGDLAPRDITINEGSTGLDPGPSIGKLQNAGLPTSVEDGKIYIQEDTVVVEEGEEISEEVAQALDMLDMEPMKIGLNLQGIWEDSTIFEPEDLDIDIERYKEDIKTAYSQAVNLSVNSSHLTEATTEMIIRKAWSESRNLAINAEIIEEDVIEEILKKAYSEGKNLESKIEEVS